MIIVKHRGRYFAKVPSLTKGEPYLQRSFIKKGDASYWQRLEGIKIWGYRRWQIIVAGGTTALRSMTSSVTVRMANDSYQLSCGDIVEYSSFQVRWRKGGREHTKNFNPNRYQSREEAEHEANMFAAYKRAELTGGVLNLPPCIRFDLSQ